MRFFFARGFRTGEFTSENPCSRTPHIVEGAQIESNHPHRHRDCEDRILDALEKAGRLQNTIIVFASDNGLAVGRHGLMGKQNVYDHSVHVPLILSGPGIPAGEERGQLCYLYDIFPTLCERAGLDTPGTVQFKSLNQVLDDGGAKHRDHLYFAFMSWQRAVRDPQYKLIEYCVNGERHTQLFDLRHDPLEMNNLAGDANFQDTLGRLRKLLQAERVRLNDGNSPFPFTDKQGKDFWTAYQGTR